MRMRSLHVVWGLSVALTVIVLPACSDDGLASGTASTSEITTTTPSSAPSPTAAVITAAPITPGPQTKTWVDLQVGECLVDVPAVDLGVVTVTIVDCAAAHQAEVFLRVPTAVNAAIADVANTECAAGFPQYTGRSIDDSPFAVTYLIDSNQDRTSANPDPSTVICLLQAANGAPLTESARR